MSERQKLIDTYLTLRNFLGARAHAETMSEEELTRAIDEARSTQRTTRERGRMATLADEPVSIIRVTPETA